MQRSGVLISPQCKKPDRRKLPSWESPELDLGHKRPNFSHCLTGTYILTSSGYKEWGETPAIHLLLPLDRLGYFHCMKHCKENSHLSDSL